MPFFPSGYFMVQTLKCALWCYIFACLSLDIPVKVVGILPHRNERGMLLKMVYALFERLSVYRYGRIELNLFISEKEYMVNEQEYSKLCKNITLQCTNWHVFSS